MKISLSAARHNKQISQKKMAFLLGVSTATVCRWERGIIQIPFEQFKKYCKVCEVPEENVEV